MSTFHSQQQLLGSYKTSLLTTCFVIVLDQASKYTVYLTMAIGQSIPEQGLLRLTYVTNTGSAFGLFTNQTTLLSLGSIVGIVILILFHKSHDMRTGLVYLCLGLQIGGAIGNLLDRLILGHVIDFIDVGMWPVFNLADSSILIGLSGLAWSLFFYQKPDLCKTSDVIDPQQRIATNEASDDKDQQERTV
jgi:signal peptidase II